ncbi:MAG: Na+/H+ antiporter NhaC family protein [Planctomycetota bacterium]
MRRPLPLSLALAAVAAVAWLWFGGEPGPERRARLAALETHLLLSEPVWADPGSAARAASEPGGGEPDVLLAESILTGAAYTDHGDGTATLRLGKVDVDLDLEAGRGRVASIARRSIVLGLRSFAEQERGVSLAVEGEDTPAPGGLAMALRSTAGGLELLVYGDGDLPDRGYREWRAPGSRSVIPPVLAIVLAIATRKPLLALLIGVLSGSILVRMRDAGSGNALSASGSEFLGGLVDVPTVYLWDRLVSSNDLYIVLFVILMLAMVGNLVRNGGIRGLMNSVQVLAKSARTTQIATWLMGLAVFFDDYANTVLVGSTMRTLTDRFRVAREKLAYLVDSTAAPVAGLSVFSTWIAFEVSTFAAQLPAAGLLSTDGYSVFLQTLPYRFYCLLTLVMVGLIAFSGRDFGPMRRAEERARRTGQVLREGAQPMVSKAATELEMAEGVRPAAWRAVVPLLAFIGTTLLVIAWYGGAFAERGPDAPALLSIPGITGVLYEGSGNKPLMIGSAVGFGLAALATVAAGLGVGEVLRSAWNTLRSMGVALAILYMAWMIGDVCAALGTQAFLTATIENALQPALLPVVLLLLAGFTAFATGSSWSTMGILLPLVVGLSYRLGAELEIGSLGLMLLCIGAVLEGAIFGDHCSPISDTTVLSSIASASDHIDHVRTQAPYALTVMGVSIAFGYLPCAYLGLSPYIGLGLAVLALVAIVFLIGRRVEDGPPPAGLDGDLDGASQ